MARRTRSIRDLRAEVEAMEARGIPIPDAKPRRDRSPSTPKPKPEPPRVRVVWAVCDIAGRAVQTFDYPNKADAEALAAVLKAKGKGNYFVRSEKVPM